LRGVAAKFNLDYQFARGREGLTYLPDSDKAKLRRQGEEDAPRINITKAITKGLRIKKGSDDTEEESLAKKQNRSRLLTLRAVQDLFDATPRDAEHRQRLETLAEVMRLSYSAAIVESNKRRREAREAA
jgi:hypothetical protein